MKILLLPGLDGTGDLFQWLTPHLEGLSYHIEALPAVGPQDYLSLATRIGGHLDRDEPLILVAESFSTGIALELGRQHNHIKGIVFVAGFLSTPSPFALRLTHKLIARGRLNNRFIRWLGRRWAFNNQATHAMASQIYDKLLTLDITTLQARLNAMKTLRRPDYQLTQPCLYLQPRKDLLINQNSLKAFAQLCPRLRVCPLDSPHFVLQTQPEAAAAQIRQFAQSLADS